MTKIENKSVTPVEFESPCLGLHLHMTARAVSRLYNRALSVTEVEVGELAILAAIRRHPTESITDLAKLLSFERTTMVRNSKRLAMRGFIVQQADTGRAVHYKLTKLGLKKYNECLPLWSKVQKAVESNLRAGNADELRSVLKDVRDVVQNQTS